MPETGTDPVNGIRYTGLCSPKFRSCLLTLHFYVPRTPETAPVHALLTDLLTSSSAAYPEISALALRLESLYAADFSAKLSLCGDSAALVFTASWLDDRYALNGEKITDAVLELMLGCLLHPNAENGAFRADAFRICRQNLLDDIDCIRNDKREYALQQAAALAYRGEPAAISAHGERAAAEQITAESAYRLWQEILQTSFADIVCVTPEPRPEIRGTVLRALSSVRRPAAQVSVCAPSPLKPVPAFAAEQMPLEQSKLVMAYKYSGIRREVMAVFCGVLGWISDSLLFENLREKQGLCYYCALQHAVTKQTVFIDTGIDSAQAQAVQDAVSEQLLAMKNGAFTDDMMERAVLRYEYQTAAATDAPDTAAEMAVIRHRLNDPRTPAEFAAAMRRVTRAELSEAAEQLRPDSVYLLQASGGEEADCDGC